VLFQSDFFDAEFCILSKIDQGKGIEGTSKNSFFAAAGSEFSLES